MKVLIRIAVAAGVLVVVAFIAAALILPSLLQSDAVRGQVESAAEEALGREVSLGALDVGLLPPSLVVAEPRVAGATPESEPLLEARAVELRLALLPLLSGTVLVDSLVIEGAQVHLVRTPEGIQLPTLGAGEPQAPAPPVEDGAGPPLTIAVREVALTDAALVLDDRAVTPATRTRIAADGSARGSALDAPVDLDLTLVLGEAREGGEIRATGRATLEGELDLDVAIEALALAPFAPYAGDRVSALEGVLDGTLAVQGSAADPSVEVDLSLREADVEAAGATLKGPLALRATLADVVAGVAGTFALDASEARVVYGEAFDKAPGKTLTLEGTFAPADGAPAIDDLRIQLDDLVARGTLRTAPRVRADLQTNAVDLEGWEEILLPLAGAPLSGALEVERLRFETEPLSVTGRVALRDVSTELPNRGPVTLRGALVFSGDTLTTEDVVAVAADQPFDLEARVEDLFGALRYEGEVKTREADVNALASAFAGIRDTLLGPLDLTGRFRGSVESGVSPLETLQAELDFDIEQGKLVGVTILESVLGQLGSSALQAGNLFAGPEIQRFYGDEFELMKGDLRVTGGVGRSTPLSIRYRDYGVELVGEIDLATFSIDMEGRVTLYESIDAAIADEVGAGNNYTPQRRDIPLASVTGRLSSPVVRVAAGSATRFAANYARDVYGDKVRRKVDKKIDEELGTGAAKALEGALEGLLGRGRSAGNE